MAIDLGDSPVGTPPTTEQQAQMRSALGLGTASTQAATAFATAGQGALASTAVQPAILTAGLATKADVADGMSGAERAKLAGIATAATANSTDAALRARASHTGTQLAASISDFSAAIAADSTITALVARMQAVQITQAAYDLLSPPDANTLYVVVG